MRTWPGWGFAAVAALTLAAPIEWLAMPVGRAAELNRGATKQSVEPGTRSLNTARLDLGLPNSDLAEKARNAALLKAPGFLDGVGAAVSTHWAGSWAARAISLSGYPPEDRFSISDDQYRELVVPGLPDEWWSFHDALSWDHALAMREQRLRLAESQAMLARMGTTGSVIAITVAILDPLYLILGAVVAGLCASWAGYSPGQKWPVAAEARAIARCRVGWMLAWSTGLATLLGIGVATQSLVHGAASVVAATIGGSLGASGLFVVSRATQPRQPKPARASAPMSSATAALAERPNADNAPDRLSVGEGIVISTALVAGLIRWALPIVAAVIVILFVLSRCTGE